MILAFAALTVGAAQPPSHLGAAPLGLEPAVRGNGPATAEQGDLTILTYNVKGLPWPLAWERDAALARIGDRLRRLRAAGRQPRVVLLQEAFTDTAKRIGRDSGYRHSAFGPGLEGPATGRPALAEKAFLGSANPLKGEGIGKITDSGLQILSDYPILDVRTAAFSATACAGYDCLANKGMVAVLIAVPGRATPVAIINTHLNARKASGVSPERALEAYRRQFEELDRFRARVVPRGVPTIIAGDLNVGRSPERRALAHAVVGRWLNRKSIALTGGSLRACFVAGAPCGSAMPRDAARALRHNKDWQIALPAAGAELVPQAIDVPFGIESDGTMLSDHIGYAVRYRLQTARRAA
ncbi:endonuclease/exonuclease/phosphatase family protein [Allosphingosinicella deserti]|nr:endonuclease/exonuclease/phosphatase family protein [Sphingomonas deserti]